MSDSPLQGSPVSNKLHLDLHAGVLVPGPSQMFIFYDCCLFSRPVRQGGCSAVDRFYVLCRIALLDLDIGKCAMQCMTNRDHSSHSLNIETTGKASATFPVRYGIARLSQSNFG